MPEFFQRLVESDQLFRNHPRWQVGQRHLRTVEMATVLEPALAAGVLHENPPPGLRGRREKVPAAMPLLKMIASSQSQVRFVHQGSGLKRLPRFFLAELCMSQFS